MTHKGSCGSSQIFYSLVRGPPLSQSAAARWLRAKTTSPIVRRDPHNQYHNPPGLAVIIGAGFTPDGADRLRRALATFKKHGNISNFKTRFLREMKNNGYEADFSTRCFPQIEGFGSYGFPESHTASFAFLVYASAWLKCHYPGGVCLRAAQFAADGVLRPGPNRPRCPRP